MAAPPSAAAPRPAASSRGSLHRAAACGSSPTPAPATRDRYGRLLAYVDSRHGDLGERQLRDGLAYVYRYRDRRFSRRDRYRHTEDDARAHRRGSWSGCAGDFHSARPGRQP